MRLCSAILAIILLSGCMPGRSNGVWTQASTEPPKQTVTTPQVKVEQSGASAAPAQATTTQQAQKIDIPSGSKVTLTFEAPRDTQMTSEAITTRVLGPVAFQPPAPPAPPTAKEISDGRLRFWYGLAIPVGLAAAIFGLVRDYTLLMIGGATVAGAGALGYLWQDHPWLLVLVAIGGTLAVTGPSIWHFNLKDKVKQIETKVKEAVT